MSGSGKTQQAIQQQQLQAQQTQNQLLQKAMDPTKQQLQFEAGSDAFNKWKQGGDYSKPPSGELLGLDLWNPSHQSDLMKKLDNITGTGATALGSQGDDTVALQLARQRQSHEDAQNAGNSYENAVQGVDQYYKGNALPWAQLQTGKFGNLYGQASNNTNNLTDAWIRMASRPSPWASVLGSALGAAGQVAGAYVGRG